MSAGSGPGPRYILIQHFHECLVFNKPATIGFIVVLRWTGGLYLLQGRLFVNHGADTITDGFQHVGIGSQSAFVADGTVPGDDDRVFVSQGQYSPDRLKGTFNRSAAV